MDLFPGVNRVRGLRERAGLHHIFELLRYLYRPSAPEALGTHLSVDICVNLCKGLDGNESLKELDHQRE